MRAREFIKSDEQVNEIAPALVAGLGALARGALTVGSRVVQSVAQGAAQLGKQAVSSVAQGAAQLGKQAVSTAVTSAANTIGTNIGNKLTGQQTTATNQTQMPTQPADLAKMKGKSIPTDLGQLKIGNINPQGLEVNLDPNSKLGGLLGNKLTLPLK